VVGFYSALMQGCSNICLGNPYLLLGTIEGGYYDSPPKGDL